MLVLKIYDQKDKKTGLEILSLHGKTKKPSKEELGEYFGHDF